MPPPSLPPYWGNPICFPSGFNFALGISPERLGRGSSKGLGNSNWIQPSCLVFPSPCLCFLWARAIATVRLGFLKCQITTLPSVALEAAHYMQNNGSIFQSPLSFCLPHLPPVTLTPPCPAGLQKPAPHYWRLAAALFSSSAQDLYLCVQ